MRLPFLALLLSAPLGVSEPALTSEDLPRVPPTPPEKAAATCAVRPGFHVELMAAEPFVVDPVAMAFDENGRLYVVEMRDYSERRDEKGFQAMPQGGSIGTHSGWSTGFRSSRWLWGDW